MRHRGDNVIDWDKLTLVILMVFGLLWGGFVLHAFHAPRLPHAEAEYAEWQQSAQAIVDAASPGLATVTVLPKYNWVSVEVRGKPTPRGGRQLAEAIAYHYLRTLSKAPKVTVEVLDYHQLTTIYRDTYLRQ